MPTWQPETYATLPELRLRELSPGSITIAHGLALYTCNPEDFDGIDELEVISIPHPDN